uniref:Uncharacterized protein n=1 Tax=Helicotheca tamesis TaxID=374047 RepID=A0A7S2MX13_9STRA|mmetsp:Transcript_4972/g.6854  ORF Transcript_4972/g.6854 Transcript_4972/m.6854 type:complete len:114 (+) Transcript_4972:342-683(+)|eukprot:CAMPEP_0185727108 /NCGR_PEP_ID=MMETSP1171-20130828/2888_1 /TAXON_ID=374046 /ORGANISM="Helicotheca tamensis, Strain CCMP826" /LENGTH=113 /DNA_ID=CAMNT_0028395609 /DNA_START=338 /DNA_END=679 /DNA_ORIENTATION=-
MKRLQSDSSSRSITTRSRDAAYQEDLNIALALSLSEAEEKEPKPYINPNSKSAYALAKEEERRVKEAMEESLLEQKSPSAVLDREVVPLSEIRSSALPVIDDGDSSEEFHELV